MGWFCLTKCCRKSSIAEELGVGMTIYFKQLKGLVLMFAFFTLLSLPSLLLFYSGSEVENMQDTKQFFSIFSLGNIG